MQDIALPLAAIAFVLLVIAFVFACISVRIPSIGAFNCLSLAVTFWIAAELVGGVARFGLVH
jgi:hypothetical protein